MNKNWIPLAVGIGIFSVLVICLCIVVSGTLGWFTYQFMPTRFPEGVEAWRATSTPRVVRPIYQTPESGSSGEAQIVPVFDHTLKALQETDVPINDLVDLARRLEGKQDVPTTLDPPESFLTTGATKEFWVTNVDTNENFRVPATLRYVTEHVYFWIEDGLSYNAGDLEALVETFENQIYPTNTTFFGSEWTPGVDGDPHLYILYARGLGANLAGYFSSADEYHPLAHEYSNAHELFLLNADNLDLDEQFTYGVLAHEFQHMIHWHQDRNEASWLNEGFSELAVFLNGYPPGGFDYAYARSPDLQLNDWPNQSGQTGPHYGASFLFLMYFLDRFGEEATRALVAHPENGLESIDQVLIEGDLRDPITGQLLSADDFFLDWTLTNYIQEPLNGEGRYTYSNYPGAPRTLETETFQDCRPGMKTRDVHQYGVDYIRITCPGDYTLRFEGSVEVGLLPQDPYSGEYAFWSNKGDESNMQLTREFDFSDLEGPISLSYWTWYDLEQDYDYLYLVASLDGEYWEILTTPSGTPEDPSGNSYGWGYNGESEGWIQEHVDLSRFAGQKVQIRFEYVTDAAVNGEGFLVDDIAIPEIGYFSDFETNDGGWEASGWVRVSNVLPQTYRLALVAKGEAIEVIYLALEPDNSLEVPVSIGDEVEEVILVVTGTTRFTRQKAGYRFEILP
jgi:immune inhibitor A